MLRYRILNQLLNAIGLVALVVFIYCGYNWWDARSRLMSQVDQYRAQQQQLQPKQKTSEHQEYLNKLNRASQYGTMAY